MNNKKLSLSESKAILNNKRSREIMARKNHLWFFSTYFPHYIKYEMAPFHKRMFTLTEDERVKILEIISFRGSAKSTIMTLSYPVWSIISKQNKKFVVIMSQTQDQAKQHLLNIKKELETNELLKADLGPFEEHDEIWGAYSIALPWYDAKITTASVGQTIRGLRHKQHRPDLVILDDIEDLASVKTKESRDKIYNLLTGEVFPAGEKNTRFIIVGNLLHDDSVLMRIKKGIDNKFLDGKYMFVPLLDDNGKIAWPGKYPDIASVKEEERKIGNEISWQREYMLKILPDEGQVIHQDWLKYYDQIGANSKDYRFTLTGIDPAASEADHADCTAAVSARVYGYGKDMKIYILPHPLNKKLAFPKAVKELKRIYDLRDNGAVRRMLVESFGYQKVLAQRLKEEGIPAEEVTPLGQDKRARLIMTSQLIADGKILFPRHGTEDLIRQIVYLGSERYDDLVDAFTLLVYKALAEIKKPATPEIFFISTPMRRSGRQLSDDWDDD